MVSNSETSERIEKPVDKISDNLFAPIALGTAGALTIPAYSLAYGWNREKPYSITRELLRENVYGGLIATIPYETISLPLYLIARGFRNFRDNIHPTNPKI